MRSFLAFLTVGAFLALPGVAHSQAMEVGHFHKAVISPYIQATFVQGEAESVSVNRSIVDSRILHVEVSGGELRVYLEGAKDLPHYQVDYREDGGQRSLPLYPNHAVVVTIVYKRLDALSLRGTETYLCESPLSAKKFTLRVYGEPNVIFTAVHISNMHSTIYGDGTLEIRSGVVNRQYYTCFGNGKINSTAITGQAAKVTSFGDAEFNVNVSDRIKVTAIGEARLRYMGNPDIVKGIHIGDMDLRKLD